MKNVKCNTLVIGILVVGIFLFSSPSLGQEKQIELTFSTHMPAQHLTTQVAKSWTEEIEKRTNGRVKMTVFPGGTLLKADKCYDGVVRGIADVGWVVLGVTKGRFPLTEVFDLPLGFKSGMSATILINEYYAKFKPKEFDETQVMFFHGLARMGIHSKKAIRRVEDFKGLKVRTTGSTARVASSLGGIPVGMPVNEAYDALARGVVDATVGGFDALKGFRWAEVTKYSADIDGVGCTAAFGLFMNKGKWNALPPDIQKIIEDVNKEWIVKQGTAWDDVDKNGKAFGLKSGNEIISFSKEENDKAAKAVKPMLDDYLQYTRKLGLPGDEALKFCADRLKELQ